MIILDILEYILPMVLGGLLGLAAVNPVLVGAWIETGIQRIKRAVRRGRKLLNATDLKA
jgi:hypothetical protein